MKDSKTTNDLNDKALPRGDFRSISFDIGSVTLKFSIV